MPTATTTLCIHHRTLCTQRVRRRNRGAVVSDTDLVLRHQAAVNICTKPTRQTDKCNATRRPVPPTTATHRIHHRTSCTQRVRCRNRGAVASNTDLASPATSAAESNKAVVTYEDNLKPCTQYHMEPFTCPPSRLFLELLSDSYALVKADTSAMREPGRSVVDNQQRRQKRHQIGASPARHAAALRRCHSATTTLS